MQSSPPTSDGKARAIRELSRSLNHSPRPIASPSTAPSDSNPTQHSGFGSETSKFFDDPDILMSTQHKLEDDTNPLPQYPHIRSTAKKVNAWHMLRSEQLNPDTSMVNKQFGDFDHSFSDEEAASVEQARGGHRSNHNTPNKMSSQFNSLYDITPPTNRSRKSYTAETGNLRRDAQIRRASRNDLDTASPRPVSKRNSPAMPTNQDRRRTSLAQSHAKVSEDESSFMDQRPPTLTIDSTKNTRWGNKSRHTSLQLDGFVEASPRVNATPRSRPTTAQTATGRSFILPDIPNLTELVSGFFGDGTPVFSKNGPARSRFSAHNNGGHRPHHIPVESIPIPEEEKAIFAALQLLQDKVDQMEHERAEQEQQLEEKDLELIELRATVQAQDKLRRSDSAQDSESGGKSGWKVEKTRLDATVQTFRTKLDRADRKVAVLEIEKKRLNTERDNMASQLGVAFQTCEELKSEKTALSNENDDLRQEVDTLRAENETLLAENESLRDQLEQDQSQHRGETAQLKHQFDRAANATEKENATLHAELARVRAQHDDHTQQLSRKDVELRKARQEQAEYARLKSDHESLKSRLDRAANATEKENATLHAELDRVRAQHDDHTQQLSRKDIELRKARQEQAEYARLKSDHELLKSQLASLKAKRDEEMKRWSRQESSFKAQVDRRDETIRQFQDMTQEHTNEAMRQDNTNLRQELAQLMAQHEEDNALWEKKEAELKRRVQHRGNAARKMTREVLGMREANNQQLDVPIATAKDKENVIEDNMQRKPSYRREDTRTRIKNRVQQEVRNSRAVSASHQSSCFEESPRKSYTGVSRFSNRSVSAPIQADKNARVESDVESTTDLSLAPRGTPYTSRSIPLAKSTVQLPADLNLTELSFIDSNQIAQLRRTIEEDRAAARRRSAITPLEQQEETVQSQLQAREDTIRSVTSAKSQRRPSIPHKSSLKDSTQRTNGTQFEEDITGNVSNIDADAEATQTKQSLVDASMLSNTSRRRRSAPTEMTSAFIVPDIKLHALKQATATTTDIPRKVTNKEHDDANCTFCRRAGFTTSNDALSVPKLVPATSRMPDDIDATLRPARSPKEALALVVKELQDERTHLHYDLAVSRAMLESHDVSVGNRRRLDMNASIQNLLRRLEIIDSQIYNLYDVLEGQQSDELTELEVENLTQPIRIEDERPEPEKKAKKVTIRSFHDEDDVSIEVSRGVAEDEELPWEGFEDTSIDGVLEGWRASVR